MTDEELRKVLESAGGADTVVSLNCPSCGSTDVVEVGGGHYHCQCCNTTFALDNGPRVVINNYNVGANQERREASSRDSYSNVFQVKVDRDEKEAKLLAFKALYNDRNYLPEDLLEKMVITDVRLFYIKLFRFEGESCQGYPDEDFYEVAYVDSFHAYWSRQMERLFLKNVCLDRDPRRQPVGEMPVYDITYQYKERNYHIYVYACKSGGLLFGKMPLVKKEDSQKIKHLQYRLDDAEKIQTTYFVMIFLSCVMSVIFLLFGIFYQQLALLIVGILMVLLLSLFICLAVSETKTHKALESELASEIKKDKEERKEREERCKKKYEEKVKELGGNL